MGLVGRSSWAFFKTVPKIHRRHSEPRTESMCLHYNIYNTCSRNLQKSPEPVWQVCLGARWLCRRGQRPICKRAEKQWNHVESVCHRSEPVLLLSQCLPVYLLCSDKCKGPAPGVSQRLQQKWKCLNSIFSAIPGPKPMPWKNARRRPHTTADHS